jgi:hypothetical protein
MEEDSVNAKYKVILSILAAMVLLAWVLMDETI